MLVLLSDSYSELEIISVSISELSSCSISHFLLTISTTDYCLKKNVSNFSLKRPFYSRQSLKDTCCFSTCTSHK